MNPINLQEFITKNLVPLIVALIIISIFLTPAMYVIMDKIYIERVNALTEKIGLFEAKANECDEKKKELYKMITNQNFESQEKDESHNSLPDEIPYTPSHKKNIGGS